jgi:hypothetical protein
MLTSVILGIIGLVICTRIFRDAARRGTSVDQPPRTMVAE